MTYIAMRDSTTRIMRFCYYGHKTAGCLRARYSNFILIRLYEYLAPFNLLLFILDATSLPPSVSSQVFEFLGFPIPPDDDSPLWREIEAAGPRVTYTQVSILGRGCRQVTFTPA